MAPAQPRRDTPATDLPDDPEPNAPAPDGPVPSSGAEGGRSSSRRILAATVVVVALIAAAALVYVVVQDDDGDLVVVIPDGTGERVDAGDDLDLLGDEVEVSRGDTLTITNDDDRIHQIGDVVVRPGETEELEFPSEGRFVYTCTIRPNNSITFSVRE